MLQIKTLGIYDSGLGGFSIYHELKTTFPDLDMVLFADQLNAPYGNKSKEEIQTIAFEAMFRFQQAGIDSVLIACNTVSAVALDFLRESFPDMNLWGIIDITVSQVPIGASVGIVATQATVDSGAYQKVLQSSFTIQKALVDLVCLIENLEDIDTIKQYLVNDDVYNQDYLILGCTHYPLVSDVFETVSRAIILDSRLPIRQFVEKLYLPGEGKTSVFTSGEPAHLTNQIKSLFNYDEEVLEWNSLF